MAIFICLTVAQKSIFQHRLCLHNAVKFQIVLTGVYVLHKITYLTLDFNFQRVVLFTYSRKHYKLLWANHRVSEDILNSLTFCPVIILRQNVASGGNRFSCDKSAPPMNSSAKLNEIRSIATIFFANSLLISF